VVLSSPISFVISVITLIILLFLFINKEWLSMGTILVQILFNN
jgi:NADH-ubiquinone oxidoreductase chain 2